MGGVIMGKIKEKEFYSIMFCGLADEDFELKDYKKAVAAYHNLVDEYPDADIALVKVKLDQIIMSTQR